MAEKEATEKDVKSNVKTKKVEIIKFHPMIAHDVKETPTLTEEKANELIEKGYARAL
ncbi:hypothetical protein [Dyadobacter sp. CY312]|uniref:hypothetical protein n=1 Tax=Dyadobacter sp. CY312 TaxID=2907303 RepID=UPI001F2C221A|nr:hypothetical protein [Dyadobacter sp. CY312]MCE7038987.1 hypothetical protein [Dyadobacter sp. CY312]